jgi:uncharacterized protein YpmS
MKTKMFKRNQLILLSIVILIVLYVVLGQREHLSVNKDNSKNWDIPELTSTPEPVPDTKEVELTKTKAQ